MANSQTRASNKYQAKAYDRINLVVKKGERERIRTHAEKQGKSLNGWVIDAIYAKMEAEQK